MLKFLNKFLTKKIDKEDSSTSTFNSNDEDVKIGSSIVNGYELESYMYEFENYTSIKVSINGHRLGIVKCIIQNQELRINDIEIFNEEHRNKGYGSELMKRVLEYSEKKKIKKIIGELSVVDYDHKEMLFHFYKKFGFDITLYNELKNNFYGRIEKVKEIGKEQN